MININGKLLSEAPFLSNRGFKFGDAVFETLKVTGSGILFWEDHYLRLMASMRIVRMEIPMTFTMEFLEQEIANTLDANRLSGAPSRVRLSIYRNGAGYYLPESDTVSYLIEAMPMADEHYHIRKNDYTIDLYKDHYVNPGLLSTVKTNNRMLNIVGSIYANENGYDNCLLLNQDKNVVEALNGNVFLVMNTTVKTPPLADGCINGILRKQLLRILSKDPNYTLDESSVSPFELQKADELFITNVIVGIQPVRRYRKKEYGTTVSGVLNEALNSAMVSRE